MIKRISNLIRVSGTMAYAFALLFAAGVLVAAYFLFTLPHRLVMAGLIPAQELAWPVVTVPFLAVGVTFAMAAAAVVAMVQNRREIVVYVEKKKSESSAALSREEQNSAGLGDLAAFKHGLAGINDEGKTLQKGLQLICSQFQAGQGAIYILDHSDGRRTLELTHGYALAIGESSTIRFDWGEGLVGQAAATGKAVCLDEIPEGYITILSGLGASAPGTLALIPMKKDKQVIGVLELATFTTLKETELRRLEEMVTYLSEKKAVHNGYAHVQEH